MSDVTPVYHDYFVAEFWSFYGWHFDIDFLTVIWKWIVLLTSVQSMIGKLFEGDIFTYVKSLATLSPGSFASKPDEVEYLAVKVQIPAIMSYT